MAATVPQFLPRAPLMNGEACDGAHQEKSLKLGRGRCLISH